MILPTSCIAEALISSISSKLLYISPISAIPESDSLEKIMTSLGIEI